MSDQADNGDDDLKPPPGAQRPKAPVRKAANRRKFIRTAALTCGVVGLSLAGWMPVDEFADRVGLTLPPTRSYETVAGFIIASTFVHDHSGGGDVPYEINRYLTPFGNFMDLGPNGVSWLFDVTDYAFLLHDAVDLESANPQEDLDVRFLLISGTPPRSMLEMDQLWNGSVGHRFDSLATDLVMAEQAVPRHPQATQWAVRSRITGHGAVGNMVCCEFGNNTHGLRVGGVNAAEWHIFQTGACERNPMHPQGGTWIFDREGWCPGAPVNDRVDEITPWVSGNTVPVDYTISPVPVNDPAAGQGQYLLCFQLMQYGPANHALDAELYDVLRPTDAFVRSDLNPLCEGPRVVLRNAGGQPLTSAVITYGVTGGMQLTYTWTGNLAHMQQTEVDLPIPGIWFWGGVADPRFTATVSQPNGGTDEYADNDHYTTRFDRPILLPSPFVITLRTNAAASENSYTISDMSGNVVHQNGALSNNTLLRDTIDLPLGCYTFHFNDSGNDGLFFFANSDGTGWLQFRDMNGDTLVAFPSDMGAGERLSFTTTPFTGISEHRSSQVVIYPNPAHDAWQVTLPQFPNTTRITLYDATGRPVHTVLQPAGVRSCTVPAAGLAAGTYVLHVDNGSDAIRRLVVKE